MIAKRSSADGICENLSYDSLLESFQNICILVTFAYLLSRKGFFQRLFDLRGSDQDRLWIIAFFGVLALVEMLLSPTETPGSFRIVAVTVSGLLGGVITGLGVGLFVCLASTLILGPETAYSGLATMVGGLLGGWVAEYRPHLQLRAVAGFLVGALSNTIWLGLVFARDPLVGTWDSLALLYVPPIVLNGMAVSLFLIIMGDMRVQQERIERAELVRTLGIANRVLPYLKYGLDPSSAGYIADIVRRITRVSAVIVSDAEGVLASCGSSGEGISAGVSNLACDAMGTRRIAFRIYDASASAGGAACAAPMFYGDKVIGCVELREVGAKRIRPEVAELGQEIAQFLGNYQMQLADLERRSEIASKAELRALEAQVHPHFLFNALNTIASLAETDGSKAAELAVELGAYYRTALSKDGRHLISLEDELKNVRHYLRIEKARFGERLQVTERIGVGSEKMLVAALSIQPLVENAVLHGLSRRSKKGSLLIVAGIRGGRLRCFVIDDGVGMTADQASEALNGKEGPHGLTILRNRLDRIYRGQFKLAIRSRQGSGTIVLLSIPVGKEDNQACGRLS